MIFCLPDSKHQDVEELQMGAFGETICRLRKEKGITIRNFAKMVELSPGFISLLERGKTTAVPIEDNIRKIALVLGCDEYILMAQAKRIPIELQEAFFCNPSKVVYLCRKLKEDKENTNDEAYL